MIMRHRGGPKRTITTQSTSNKRKIRPPPLVSEIRRGPARAGLHNGEKEEK